MTNKAWQDLSVKYLASKEYEQEKMRKEEVYCRHRDNSEK